MKKRVSIISIMLCLVAVVFALVGCSPAGAPDHSVSDPQYAVSVADPEKELDDFISIVGDDRTSFTQAEENAAIYLQSRLTEYGYTDVVLQDFTATEKNEDVNSRNVVARYLAENRTADTKNVIIGAYYDNRYKAPYKSAAVYKSQGALANGTGVATLLAVAKYFQTQKPALDFDVTIVFFGGSFVSDVGAREFYKKMTHAERMNTVLMVEMQRLGVDHVYAYSDARKTKRESFFDAIAVERGLDVYKVTQKSPLVTDATAYEGIPYYQWAHSGVFGVFFDAGIPTLNLIGANWETINLTDTESSEHDNIAYTDKDNLDTLKRLHPQYAQKMATAATLVIGAIEDESFLSVMNYDRTNFPNTDVLTMSWIWYLVVLGVVIIFAAVMLAVSSHLAKKYPITAPAPKRMKMAVFGMDYEDKDSSDIFIDIKSASPQDDIFPGIPNNDGPARSTGDPFDDIFPSLFGMPYAKPERKRQDDPVEPTEIHDVEVIPDDADMAKDVPDAGSVKKPDGSEVADGSEKTDAANDGDVTENTEVAQRSSGDAANDVKTASDVKTDERPAKKRSTNGTTKRRTVSAGKSNGAQATKRGASSDNKQSDDNAPDGE